MSVAVRVRSHRAADKLKTLLGVDKLDWYWTFAEGGKFAMIPTGRLNDARAIKGITKARPNGTLARCWQY